MADTTISSSSKKNTSDWDDAPIPYAPPPPKTTTSNATTATTAKPTGGASSSPQPPPPTTASSYDPKDAAKYMPVTPLAKSGPPGPMELSLDALKSRRDALEKRLAAPVDYPERKADQARLTDVKAQINEREAQLQRMNGPTPKGKIIGDGSAQAGANPANGETRHTAIGGNEDRLRIGYADATSHPTQTPFPRRKDGQSVDQVAVGVLKYQNQVPTSDGGTRTTTVVVGGANAQTGPINPDGSKGIGTGAGVTAAGIEETWASADGSSLTLGGSVSESGGASVGVKPTPDSGTAICGRVEVGDVTLGACVPVTDGGDSK